jgi:hypothetical protein
MNVDIFVAFCRKIIEARCIQVDNSGHLLHRHTQGWLSRNGAHLYLYPMKTCEIFTRIFASSERTIDVSCFILSISLISVTQTLAAESGFPISSHQLACYI